MLTVGAHAQIIALGVSYFFAVTALDVTTNVGTIDDLTSLARIILVRSSYPCATDAARCSPGCWKDQHELFRCACCVHALCWHKGQAML